MTTACLASVVLLLSYAVPLQDASEAPADLDLEVVASSRAANWLPLPVLSRIVDGGTPAAVRQLCVRDSLERARAAFLIGETCDKSAVAALHSVLADPSRPVRIHAGIALCRLGDNAGMKAASAALVGSRPWVRYYAVVGLWQLGTQQALRALEQHRHGQTSLVAEAIDWALAGRAPSDAGSVEPARSSGVDGPDWEDLWELAVLALVYESDWWWHKGNYDQCVRCNDALTFLDPSAEDSYSNSAWLLWSGGHHTEAIGVYHRCIEANPQSNHGAFYLGFYYFQHGLHVEAEPYLRRAVTLRPGDDIARRAYAHCLEKLGRPTEAIAQWEALLQLKPNDGAAVLNLNRLRSIVVGAQAH